MRDMAIFFTTKVKSPYENLFVTIGNIGLAPLRYLWHGKTVQIVDLVASHGVEIHHVTSFHKNGAKHCSRTQATLVSSQRSLLRTVASILLVAPGLFLSLFKVLGYLFSSKVREQHRLVKEHFTPVDCIVGSKEKPAKTIDGVRDALSRAFRDPMHHPVHSVIIYGENLEIDEDPGILPLKPAKLILDGASLVEKDAENNLIKKMVHSRKWEWNHFCNDPYFVPFRKVFGDFSVTVQRVRSVDEALSASRLKREDSSKPYSTVLEVGPLREIAAHHA